MGLFFLSFLFFLRKVAVIDSVGAARLMGGMGIDC